MLLSNIEQIPGKTIIEHYGVVSGSTVRAKNVGRGIALNLGRKLRWNPKTELFVNDEEANARLSYPMRKPWSI